MTETNYEHYKDEIIKTLLQEGCCGFIKEYILKSESCNDLSCSECDTKTKEWLNAPYGKPKIEIDWEKVPEDTPVYVSNYCEYPTEEHLCRHFSEYFKGTQEPFEVWEEGKTSFTTVKVNTYRYCSLVRKEDIEKYAKK